MNEEDFIPNRYDILKIVVVALLLLFGFVIGWLFGEAKAQIDACYFQFGEKTYIIPFNFTNENWSKFKMDQNYSDQFKLPS